MYVVLHLLIRMYLFLVCHQSTQCVCVFKIEQTSSSEQLLSPILIHYHSFIFIFSPVIFPNKIKNLFSTVSWPWRQREASFTLDLKQQTNSQQKKCHNNNRLILFFYHTYWHTHAGSTVPPVHPCAVHTSLHPLFPPLRTHHIYWQDASTGDRGRIRGDILPRKQAGSIRRHAVKNIRWSHTRTQPHARSLVTPHPGCLQFRAVGQLAVMAGN